MGIAFQSAVFCCLAFLKGFHRFIADSSRLQLVGGSKGRAFQRFFKGCRFLGWPKFATVIFFWSLLRVIGHFPP